MKEICFVCEGSKIISIAPNNRYYKQILPTYIFEDCPFCDGWGVLKIWDKNETKNN